jgi:hypothetical protein
MEETFPIHMEKLEAAGLIKNEKKKIKLGELFKKEQLNSKNEELQKKKKDKEKQRKRSIFFKISKSEIWRVKPIQEIIKEIKRKFPSLKWLRVSMCVKRFSNLRECFQGDLTQKLNEDLISQDFETRKCNCNKASKKKDGTCAYAGNCRTMMVVYEATCNFTGKKYIGNTQRTVKKRIQEHVAEVQKKVTKGESSDSFANHFCQFIPKVNDDQKVRVQDHLDYQVKILWKGNAISCVKSFGKKSCRLCMKERIEIIKAIYKNKNQVINSCNEIYGSCRHNPHFHRYHNQRTTNNASTDESNPKDERVKEPPDSTKSVYITGSSFFPESDDRSVTSMTDSDSLSSINLTDRTPNVSSPPRSRIRRDWQTIDKWA